MSAEASGALGLAALVVALVALVLSLVALSHTRRRQRTAPRRRDRTPLPADVAALRGEVEALRLEVDDAFRHLAVVRYDAFGDMGGQLSWSVAMLDDNGDGLVMTSIHGRSDSRTYAKGIAEWDCDQQLSPEEAQAIELARAR